MVLGVIEDIAKHFRRKPLQRRPDEETDPENKDTEEDMMKQLNLAKHSAWFKACVKLLKPYVNCEICDW